MASAYGYAIHPLAIVLLCLLGAGIIVAGCCAVHRSMYRSEYETMTPTPAADQAQYMNQVRWRNLNVLTGMFRGGAGGDGRIEGRNDFRTNDNGNNNRRAAVGAARTHNISRSSAEKPTPEMTMSHNFDNNNVNNKDEIQYYDYDYDVEKSNGNDMWEKGSYSEYDEIRGGGTREESRGSYYP